MEFPEYSTLLSVYKRSNMDIFLKYLAENTEPILFSNGTKAYVDRIIVHWLIHNKVINWP